MIAFSNCNSFRSEDLAPLSIPVTVYSSQTRGEVTVPAWRLVTGDNRLTLMRHFDLMSGHNSVGNTQVCGLFLRLRVPAPGMMLMLVLPHLLASDPMSFLADKGHQCLVSCWSAISSWCPIKKKNVGAVCGLQPNPPTKMKLWKKGGTRAFDLTRQPPAPPRRTSPEKLLKNKSWIHKS